jgi:hypothetical protein
MNRLVLALLLVGACAKKSEEPAPGSGSGPAVPALSAEEAQRGRDACADYVQKVCACAAKLPAVKQQCDLARSLPDAVRLGLEVAASPDSQRNDVIGAQKAMRQAVKECIEETAKLPSLGCQ